MSEPQIHPDTLVSIARYAMLEISLEELCGIVRSERGAAFNHNEKLPWVTLNQVCPEPKVVRITRKHVENALEKRRLKQISDRQIINWATMIMINDAYYWDREDADVVGGWVQQLSLDLIPED